VVKGIDARISTFGNAAPKAKSTSATTDAAAVS
jgi:hypothetical protein